MDPWNLTAPDDAIQHPGLDSLEEFDGGMVCDTLFFRQEPCMVPGLDSCVTVMRREM